MLRYLYCIVLVIHKTNPLVIHMFSTNRAQTTLCWRSFMASIRGTHTTSSPSQRQRRLLESCTLLASSSTRIVVSWRRTEIPSLPISLISCTWASLPTYRRCSEEREPWLVHILVLQPHWEAYYASSRFLSLRLSEISNSYVPHDSLSLPPSPLTPERRPLPLGCSSRGHWMHSWRLWKHASHSLCAASSPTRKRPHWSVPATINNHHLTNIRQWGVRQVA